MDIFQVHGSNKSGNDSAKKIFPSRSEIGALSAIKPASLSDPMNQLSSTQGWSIRLFQNLQINATVDPAKRKENVFLEDSKVSYSVLCGNLRLWKCTEGDFVPAEFNWMCSACSGSFH